MGAWGHWILEQLDEGKVFGKIVWVVIWRSWIVLEKGFSNLIGSVECSPSKFASENELLGGRFDLRSVPTRLGHG